MAADDLPRFPDFPLASVKKTSFWPFENDDFRSQADVQKLIQTIFDNLEHSFYIYCEENTPLNHFVSAAERAGVLYVSETQGFYYRHPNLPKDYVRIIREDPLWVWEKEVKVRGPMFYRHEVKLSERGKRELTDAETIRRQAADRQREQASAGPDNPLKLEPNFMVVGIDLRKA